MKARTMERILIIISIMCCIICIIATYWIGRTAYHNGYNQGAIDAIEQLIGDNGYNAESEVSE